MKLNREQISTVLAVLILIVGAREILLGVFAPTGRVLPVHSEITRSRREVVPRTYRTFTAANDIVRNPFVFAEGWRPLDVLPMAVPPLPPAPRPVSGPLHGTSVLDGGVDFVEGRVAATRSADGESGRAVENAPGEGR